MFSSRDWFEKLHRYFSTYWSHLWLPLNGNPNMINIKQEIYFKHTVTDLEAPNEPSSNEFPVLRNYSCEIDFGNFSPCLSEVLFSKRLELSLHDSPEIIEQCSKFEQNIHAQFEDTKMTVQKVG
jgi:hypothetical protein